MMNTDDMQDESTSMSTIEKAAARLAARAQADGAADRPATTDASGGVRAPGAQPSTDWRAESSERDGADGAVTRCELDLRTIASRGFLTPTSDRSALAQQMRRLKRPLLLRVQRGMVSPDQGPPPNLIMITSSLPGEGKTFTAINLAMSMTAEVDQRVLLVDADPSQGDVARQLGLPPSPGLAGLLTRGSASAEREVMSTNVAGLSILPAGESLEHVDELYASTTMAAIVHSLAMADPRRIVIFDSPPLLATTESSVLARLIGQVVVVVEANRTPREALSRAVNLLEGCRNVHVVLNKARDVDDTVYGYGVFQHRRRGSRDDAAPKAEGP
jgi:protein-tyrosine kinase